MTDKEYKEGKYKEGRRERDIISEFYNYWRIFKRHWLPAVAIFCSLVALSTLYGSRQKPIYRSQGQLLFKQEEKSVIGGLQSTEDQGNPQASGWLDADRILDTETRVLLSAPVLQQTLDIINKSNKAQEFSLDLDEFRKSLIIKKAANTNVLVVSYQSTDPKVAALVVNQLMKTYLDKNLLATRATATAARKFITAQLPEVTENAVSADLSLRRFKEKYNITDLDATKGALTRNIERLESEIDSVEAQLSDLKSRNVALQTKLGMSSQQAIAVSSLRQSPMVQGILEDYRENQRKLADVRARFDEKHPTITQLKEKEVQIKNVLQTQVTNVLKGQRISSNNWQVGQIQDALTDELIKSEVNRIGLVNQLATLNTQKVVYQKQAKILPRLEQQQRELERRRLVAESTYEALLKSLQEVRIRENQTVGNVRIIETALAQTSPVTSKQTGTIAMGSLAGVLIAGSFIYLLEAADKKIRTVQEARSLFEYTLLGTIPAFNKKGVQLPVILQPRSFISESYWILQSNLKFLNADNASKVIVVTSSVPKEGKSTICANLAASMAQLGHKVLIIDADMHFPLQHQLWEVVNTKGLSDIVNEDINQKENVFHKLIENLYLITSGTLPPNPLLVADSRNMSIFLKECALKYDYVFIDTPALAVAADANILGRKADGVVIVTRPGVADSASSKLAKDYLDQSGQNVLGIVINGVIPGNEPQSSLVHYYAQVYNGNSSLRRLDANREKNWLDNLKFIKRS